MWKVWNSPGFLTTVATPAGRSVVVADTGSIGLQHALATGNNGSCCWHTNVAEGIPVLHESP
jgi:hypothetical protein